MARYNTYMKMLLTIAVLAVIMAAPVMAQYSSSENMSKNATNAMMGTTGRAGNMSTNATMGTTGQAGQAVTIGLTAQNIKFNTSTITVPAGAKVTINFNNMDSGVAHNLAVYTDSSAANKIFIGQIITGPNTTTYTFTAPSKPGTYFFRCDVHPTAMTGQFIVK
jgi:plastocyanin